MTDLSNSPIGKPLLRREDYRFLTGAGQYTDDVVLPGQTHGYFLRSPHAHARIKSIDKRAALALPGVAAVITGEEAAQETGPLPCFANPPVEQRCIALGRVRHVGEPVVLVVADSRYIAEDAANLVAVEYEPLASVGDCRAAIEPGAPLVHLGSTSNIAARLPVRHGAVEAAFAGAPHVFRDDFYLHRGGAFFIECRGVVAEHEPSSDSYTLHVTSQGSHRIKEGILDLLDVSEHQIRVITPDVGGGFGPKGALYPEYPVAAVAARILGRPVKWVSDRHEDFMSTNMERDQYWEMEIAVTAEAKILGVRGRLVHEQGAYLPSGIVLPWIAATTVPGPYVVPAFQMDVIAALTNKPACSPVRGAGRPQGIFVMERLMDRVARELGLDPAEVRRRNFIKPEQMPYNVGIIFRDGRPVVYDSGDYPACQENALVVSDYEGFRARQAESRANGKYLGIGISNVVEGTGLGPYEGATVRIARTGKVTVFTGATPQGQSHKTTFAQIVADQLAVDIADVTIVTGDTGTIAWGMGTFAARSAVNAGSSCYLAAVEVGKKIKDFASRIMEVSPEDLELRDGHVGVRGVPGMQKTYREIAIHAISAPGMSNLGGLVPGLEYTAYFTPDQSTYSNGTHVAEVEVDIETGEVTIRRYVVFHDCGKVINPLVVEGQVVGGVAHGVGNALFERMVYDDNSQPQSTTFAEYLLTTAPHMPNVEVHHMETPSPLNPIGVKGAGEAGTNPAIAAIVNAVNDALMPFGVWITEAPITPQRIVELLGDAALGRTR